MGEEHYFADLVKLVVKLSKLPGKTVCKIKVANYFGSVVSRVNDGLDY